MGEPKKTVKKVCRCENCGNESEMTITCSLEETEVKKAPEAKKPEHVHVKGSATCSHCGNEADMWIDI